MRSLLVVFAVAALLPASSGSSQEGAANSLIGSWKLISYQLKVVGEDTTQDVFGSQPVGRLIMTPERKMAAFLSRGDRKQPNTDADATTALATMISYTGNYRLEGDKWITKVDGAWSEGFKAVEQVRFFTIEGDRLSIRTAEQASVTTFPGKKVVGTLLWERER